jgi:hypothetical protein
MFQTIICPKSTLMHYVSDYNLSYGNKKQKGFHHIMIKQIEILNFRYADILQQPGLLRGWGGVYKLAHTVTFRENVFPNVQCMAFSQYIYWLTFFL